MSFSYSGSVTVDRGIAKIFTDATYYSFKTTERCRIGVDGNPLVWVKAEEEFVISIDSTYMFDRDTKISLSYPIVEEPAIDKEIPAKIIITTSATGYTTAAVIIAPQEITSGVITGFVNFWRGNTSGTTITFRIQDDGVTIFTTDIAVAGQQYTSLFLLGDISTTIAKGSLLELQVENSAVTYIDEIGGDKIPTYFTLSDIG